MPYKFYHISHKGWNYNHLVIFLLRFPCQLLISNIVDRNHSCNILMKKIKLHDVLGFGIYVDQN